MRYVNFVAMLCPVYNNIILDIIVKVIDGMCSCVSFNIIFMNAVFRISLIDAQYLELSIKC